MTNRRDFLKGAGAGLVTTGAPIWTFGALAADAIGQVSLRTVTPKASGLVLNAPSVNIPERVLVALSTADKGRGIPFGMKHVTSAFHPPSSRIFFTGGDHASPVYGNSYRQETFALDVAARYANSADRNAGWTVEYPYVGYGGSSVQPKHPDVVSFTWDANRGVFWMVSGLQYFSSSESVPGETSNLASDPNFVFYKAMTFDPVAAPSKRWKNTGFDWAKNSDGTTAGSPTGEPDHRHAIHDPVNDVILVPCAQGDGSNLGVMKCSTGAWSYFNLNGWGGYPGVQRGSHLAADFAKRRVYHVACTGSNYPDGTQTAHLVSFNMDAPYTSHDHGAVPEQCTINAYEMSFVTWDSNNKVLLYIPWTVPDTSPPNQVWSTTQGIRNIYAYHPETALWETIPAVTSPANTYFVLRSACFDPVNNVHVFTGGVPDVDPNSNFFVFRYKSLPAWLNGQPLSKWIPIAGTELRDSDISVQSAAGLGRDYGRPNKGIFDFSGAALKNSTSELLVFGGGGAGAWAGNDVRSLKLSDDVPRWRTVVKPSPSTAIWPSPSPDHVAHARMKDGTPNARHSQRQTAFIDSRDMFMSFGCQFEWETDSGQFPDVDSVPLSTGIWNTAKTHPDLPFRLWGPPGWAVKHPDTEEVYVATYNCVSKWSPGTNSWSTVLTADVTFLSIGPADIDPNRNVIVQLGPQTEGGPWRAAAVDLTRGAMTTGNLVGPFAANVLAVQNRNCGFVFDRGLGKFLLYQDDGVIYSLAPAASGTDWYVDKLPLTGTPPAAGAFAVHAGVWTRMQYVPALGGVVVVPVFDQPAYFIRTGLSTTTPPSTPPSVAITSPTGGTVSGVITVAVNASDDVGVTRVDLLVNDQVVGQGTVAPFQFTWNTANVVDSNVAMKAIAYDVAGNNTTSAVVALTVANSVKPPPSTPPSVAITSPTGGTVSGVITVAINASDNKGVTRVDLLVNDQVVGTGTGAPYRFTWNTANVADSKVAMKAIAYNAAGNNATSAVVALTVANGVTSPPSTAIITFAIEYYNAALDHYFITASASDINALDRGTFPGWARTGQSFPAYPAQALAGISPVCRFYIPPQHGDSHFFSADPSECAFLAKAAADPLNYPNFSGYTEEDAAVFFVKLPDSTGACQSGTVPVFRLWNQRIDSNHRYTTSPATVKQMQARNYVIEGAPPNFAAMCVPK